MKLLTSEKKKNKGAAMTEFVVSLAFFVPLFLAVPVIGKYSSFKQKNIESGRYAVWERTVWSDHAGTWNDNENRKTDEQIATEVDRRFFGRQIQGLASAQTTDSHLWVDRKQNQMLVPLENASQRINVQLGESPSPMENYVADELAYDGVPLVGNTLASLQGTLNSTIGRVIPNCNDFPGVDFENGMNLGYKTYATVNLSADIQHFETLTSMDDTVKEPITFTTSGTILSNAWNAPSESIFKQRVGRLTFDDAVRCIAAPAQLISYLPVFREARKAKNVASSGESIILLEDYKK